MKKKKRKKMSQLGSWGSKSASPYQQQKENGHKSGKTPAEGERVRSFWERPTLHFIIIYLSDSWNSSSPSFGPGNGVLSEIQAKHLESEKVHYRSWKMQQKLAKCKEMHQILRKNSKVHQRSRPSRARKKNIVVTLSQLIYWHSSWKLL